jgi:hypothetical protein
MKALQGRKDFIEWQGKDEMSSLVQGRVAEFRWI